jgi:hypothetical protein
VTPTGTEDAQSASECVPQFPNRNLVPNNPQKPAVSPDPIRYTGNSKNKNARDHPAGVFILADHGVKERAHKSFHMTFLAVKSFRKTYLAIGTLPISLNRNDLAS